jgi:hypothetical protein
MIHFGLNSLEKFAFAVPWMVLMFNNGIMYRQNWIPDQTDWNLPKIGTIIAEIAQAQA